MTARGGRSDTLLLEHLIGQRVPAQGNLATLPAAWGQGSYYLTSVSGIVSYPSQSLPTKQALATSGQSTFCNADCSRSL